MGRQPQRSYRHLHGRDDDLPGVAQRAVKVEYDQFHFVVLENGYKVSENIPTAKITYCPLFAQQIIKKP